MSKMLVTSNQTDSVMEMANAKGVTREQFQKALDDGRVARFLDGLKVDVFDIRAPKGARIHIVRVKVKPDRPWQEAVNAAGPNTPENYNVRKVGDQYPAGEAGEIEEDLILLNYPKGDGDWDKANAWAQGAGLQKTVPREAFAIGEQHPKLHEELGVNPMYAVATTECTFGDLRYACYVWWYDSDREARLDWVGSFDVANVWFVFRR